jgi:tetratricopeptide (TPR) repeat protein
MGRLLAFSYQRKSARVLSFGIAAVVLFVLPLLGNSQESGQWATLRGTVRDSQGQPAAATVQLQVNGTMQILTTHADSRGAYSFTGLRQGVYSLRARVSGTGDATIPSLFIGSKETKNVDLTLGPAQTRAAQIQAAQTQAAQTQIAQAPSAQTPKFFDPPQFTVAGVTDTTSLGGHGSDTVVRTRETLAKETASLGKGPTGAPSGSAPSADEKLLRENVERELGSFEANYRMGEALIGSGKARDAISYLERAAALNPGDYKNAYDLALANADAGNDERAREKVLALLPGHDTAELHHLLADVQERLGNSLDAVHQYQRAAELDPREAYLFDWGSELLLHHAPEPALEVFGQGNRLFPRSVRMLVGLGAAWFARGADDQAVRRICEASDLDPDNSIPYLFLGRMQRAEAAPSDEVVARLHRFVTLQPQNAEANYYYAVSLWKLRRNPEDAASMAQIESLLNHAIAFDPKLGGAYLQLGMLHSEQRDFAKAIADYQLAIRADPQMEEAHYRLAEVYRQTGETDKAKAELQIYDQMSKASAEKVDHERHEIRQFVYTLRDQPVPQKP